MELVTLTSEIIKFLGLTNTKISNNQKQLSPFLGKGGGGGLPPIKLPNLTGGGDNLAGHCFVLGDLTPINVLK